MKFGQGSVNSDAMNQHKMLSGAKMSTNFDVGSYPPCCGKSKSGNPMAGMSSLKDGWRREGKA